MASAWPASRKKKVTPLRRPRHHRPPPPRARLSTSGHLRQVKMAIVTKTNKVMMAARKRASRSPGDRAAEDAGRGGWDGKALGAAVTVDEFAVAEAATDWPTARATWTWRRSPPLARGASGRSTRTEATADSASARASRSSLQVGRVRGMAARGAWQRGGAGDVWGVNGGWVRGRGGWGM